MGASLLFSTRAKIRIKSKKVKRKIRFHCYSFILRLPRPWDHSGSIEHVNKSLHAKYGGFPSSIRREKAKIHLMFYVFLFMIFVFLKYFSFSPLKFPSPRSLNPSKIIFLIIKYIQNIYCMVICPENISSGNLIFVIFLNQKLR